MDLPIRPRPSNLHKPRVRLPAADSRFARYLIRVPVFLVKSSGDDVTMTVVAIVHESEQHCFDLSSAISNAITATKFTRMRFMGDA